MFWTRRKSFWANKKGQGTLEVVFGLVQNVLDLSKLIVPNKIEWVQNSFESIKGIKVPKYTLLPCPFSGPKMFWVGPNFLCQTKNLFTYCGSHKHFVPDKKMICIP